MATPPPNEAIKLAILRQQLLDQVKRDEQYNKMAERTYTPSLPINPDWAPKKADGGSMSQDAMQLALMNKPKHMAYGGPARNWAPGHEEKLKKALHGVMFREPSLVKGVDTAGQLLEHIKKTTGPEHMDEQLAQEMERLEKRHAINQWLESNFSNYVKKQMATEKDPVRMQAETGVNGFPIAGDPSYWERKGATRRKVSGGEQMGKSDVAKHWENKTDAMIEAEKAGEHQDMMHLAPGMYSDKDEWIKKLDPETKLWSLTEHFDPRDLGLDHIRDVLHEDLVSGRIRPEQLNKISMAQAVKRAHEYDVEMEKKRQETAIKSTNDMPMVHEYPETGMKWIELTKPQGIPSGHSVIDHPNADVAPQGLKSIIDPSGKTVSSAQSAEKAADMLNNKTLEDALEYEGNTMGHCVGGKGYCEKVKKGTSRIFSLRDAKGEPHVTIETAPDEQYKEAANILGVDDPTSEDVRLLRESGRLPKSQERIIQIKGKGNRKPHAKYIPHVQHFVKSGDWSHIGDYENTDLIQIKKGQHATKEEVEALGRHHYPEHNMPAENVLMHYDRMRGMPEMQNEATKNFISDMEAGNYRMPAPVIKKAEGGNVQLSVEQMRQALMNAGKPMQDMSQIGAQEAPNMPVKNFVVPQNGAQGPLPMGGVDMSPQQPGQQMLPTNAMEPNPLQPQQPQPPAGPAPLGGGSNILQMTPQGQKMAALGGSPQGNMPPPKMAVGGPVPVNNHPFQSAGDRPLPFMAKVGGSDNRPMDNQSMDNGATTFNMDNIQELAKGGQPNKPLHYEPSPSLSKAQIEAMAERMARQMSGLDNPNNKTLQQLAREQNLDIGIKGSKKMDVPVINYEELKGAYSVGVPGDTSRGGVKPTRTKSMGAPKAGEYLQSIGGEELDKPVGLYGGKDYGAYGHPAGWASDLAASAGMFNVVKKLAEENPEREVYGHYHKMSPEALNHALHMLDVVLSHHKPHASPAERIAMLNDLMRNQKTTVSKHDVPYPEFPGFENPEDIMLHGQLNSGMRKKIIGLLGKEKYFPGGKQKLDDIIYAISHPELRNIETGAGGSSIIKFDPSRELRESISPHPTYGHDIPSRLVGRTRYTTPAEILAPRSMANAVKEIKAMGKKVVPFNQAKMNIIREPIDEQYINQMGAYEQAMKKRLGYKKGGKVKLSTNMDTINLELSKSRKKAK